MKPTPNSPPDRASLLAFGAHPDDIEFGCGAVIARETAAGHAAHFVVCSRGEAATHGTPAEREAEARQAAALLGATIEFIDLGGDAHFEHRLAHVLTVAALLRRVRPGIVLAPTLVENQHPDHARLGAMVRDACRLARYGGVAELKPLTSHVIHHLLYYAITPDAEPTGAASVLMDVSAPGVIAAWTAAMEAHGTQAASRNYVELQLTRAKLQGLRAGLSHAVALWPNDTLVFDSLTHLDRATRRF